jgi:hypothetical protein
VLAAGLPAAAGETAPATAALVHGAPPTFLCRQIALDVNPRTCKPKS